MGQHKREGIKGDGYKVAQRTIKRGRYVKLAGVTESWMIKHGWRKTAEGKWERS